MDLQHLYPSQNDTPPPYRQQERHLYQYAVIERLVTTVGSFLVAILIVRFVLALLGANPQNGFASFVYSFTAPLVSPFYNLFSYDHPSLGIASFEGYTLVAAAIYGLVTTSLTRIAAIGRRV